MNNTIALPGCFRGSRQLGQTLVIALSESFIRGVTVSSYIYTGNPACVATDTFVFKDIN